MQKNIKYNILVDQLKQISIILIVKKYFVILHVKDITIKNLNPDFKQGTQNDKLPN